MNIVYLISLLVLGISMGGLYIKKYRHLPITTWIPGAAWTRAIIYFVICNLISVITGTFDYIVSQEIVTLSQLADPAWWIFVSICFIYIFIAYWILWARMTLHFDRKFHIGSEIIFGVVWGLSMAQVLLSFYRLWIMTGLTGVPLYLVTYACMGAWQYFTQDYFWDVYVSPEHDTPQSIIKKTLISHIPNVALLLAFLMVFNNFFIFMTAQAFGLVAAAIFQRFPAPWTKGKFDAPMTKPGLFGLPHGAGYLGNQEKEKKG
jgi:hypothetical protein